MKRMPMMVLMLSVSGIATASDAAPLPARRVESVSVAQAESTAPVAASAVAPAPAPAVPKAGSVGQWLQLQASGRVASPVMQGQSAAERELVNQRLLDSYQNQSSQSADASSSSGGLRTTTP